jgi:hypothetical protein
VEQARRESDRTIFSPPPTVAPLPDTKPAGVLAAAASRLSQRGRSNRWTMQKSAPAASAM